jgi:hypothetical protein
MSRSTETAKFHDQAAPENRHRHWQRRAATPPSQLIDAEPTRHNDRAVDELIHLLVAM